MNEILTLIIIGLTILVCYLRFRIGYRQGFDKGFDYAYVLCRPYLRMCFLIRSHKEEFQQVNIPEGSKLIFNEFMKIIEKDLEKAKRIENERI